MGEKVGFDLNGATYTCIRLGCYEHLLQYHFSHMERVIHIEDSPICVHVDNVMLHNMCYPHSYPGCWLK